MASVRSSPAQALWSALISDAAVVEDKNRVEKTPLNFLDVAQVSFLKHLRLAADAASQPRRARKQITVVEALTTALFQTWERQDDTLSFRWDPIEDSRHAYRWAAPTSDKQGVEHGANILASFGLRSMTVVPAASGTAVRLRVRGGRFDRGHRFAIPIWRDPASLAAIEALLAHPRLRESDLDHLGVEQVRVAERFNPRGGEYSNVTRARPIGVGRMISHAGPGRMASKLPCARGKVQRKRDGCQTVLWSQSESMVMRRVRT